MNASPDDVIFDTYNNRFGRSYILDHLNSNKDNGYLVGCSEELRAVMATVVVSTPYCGADDDVCCRVFPPSPEELHVDVDKGYLEGALDHYSWEYFLDTPTDRHEPCEKRVFCTPNGAPKDVWTRSHDAIDTIHLVTTNGRTYGVYSSRRYSVVPACVVIGRKTQEAANEYTE